MKKSFSKQDRIAGKELKKTQKRFKPKETRYTVPVRIQKKWHSKLKVMANEKKMTLSKLHDEIYPTYFKHNQE